MSWFRDTFGINIQDTVCPNIYQSGGIRISVITERLIRVERQSEACFCDKPTQAVLHRDLGKVAFHVARKNGMICINTAYARLITDENTGALRQIKLKGGYTVTDIHEGNLGGTVRTLDNTAGAVKLGEGILSKNGAAMIDDSASLTLEEDGRVLPRRKKGSDIYYFLYGHDYLAAVQDFYRITGATPLIPRFALSNWWSRYKAYTGEEYLALMHRFRDEEIPISVATVDMDWHWVDIKKRFGKDAMVPDKKRRGARYIFEYLATPGWTGYSWNTELFPDYKAFLKELGEMGHKVTLNLHPAEGVRFFEDMYDEFADFMGVDKAKKEKIRFDISDPKFWEGYFKFCHHKYEEEGVAFWWMDWQQGSDSPVKGLDPLWALNHYHLLDNGRNGKRGLILSRFAGAGSHRYPLGFSGDTRMNWPCLQFQPYFTATASNIGYSWWSHDIGGHMLGYNDDELYTRWVQFGVFSPIMRLHSSNNEFMGKEPWRYSDEAGRLAIEALRLRHRLLPYIYTMNYRTHTEGRALIEPMYYHYPENENAYTVPNEYFFGSELIAAPITEKRDKITLLAGTEIWLPAGRFTDIFTGRIYEGEGRRKVYRDLSNIPVLAKEGAIIPLAADGRHNAVDNPAAMELLLYRGNGKFTLYEDDGESMAYRDGAFAETDFTLCESENKLTFEIAPVRGDVSLVPKVRSYTLSFKDICSAKSITVYINGRRVKTDRQSKAFVKLVLSIRPTDRVKITLSGIEAACNPPVKEALTDLISRFQGSNAKKQMLFRSLFKDGSAPAGISAAAAGAIMEILEG
ncbi:MAG: DUF5110 domain-containing protein [Clostridia bacterium]|nr:DUF5110 domain-containing protein [Clostridia bacterium]